MCKKYTSRFGTIFCFDLVDMKIKLKNVDSLVTVSTMTAITGRRHRFLRVFMINESLCLGNYIFIPTECTFV